MLCLQHLRLTVWSQPNLQPPITTVAQALDYQSRLQKLEPNVRYLMSLYLHISFSFHILCENHGWSC